MPTSPKPAQPSTVIADFPGLTDVPRSAINSPPGSASEQMNATCPVEGELLIRRGILEVTFET